MRDFREDRKPTPKHACGACVGVDLRNSRLTFSLSLSLFGQGLAREGIVKCPPRGGQARVAPAFVSVALYRE